ncbi:MAG: hypothetical protein VB064_14600, partial [Oscillospiraceae bacterium]|nr:hypothetical protein [Oscillospiraceae bacterium]
MKNYFEGLYFKQQAGECALAFIPAVHRNKNGSSASLQIVSDKTAYITDFPIESVKMDRKGPAVNIGNNRFSLDGIHLDARGDGFEIFGDLEYRDLLYPKYDIMGPFKY